MPNTSPSLSLSLSLSHSEIGSSLLDRLCRPLLPGDPDFRSLNDNAKRSLSFLREKLEEIERHSLEMGTLLPQQETILREFLIYCEFEHRIEKVLLWLQEHGLTKVQVFSHIGENGEAVKTQVSEFMVFTEKCQVSCCCIYVLAWQPGQLVGRMNCMVRCVINC